MKRIALNVIIYYCFCLCLSGQTKAELEENRRKTLEEITYVDNLLKTTAKEKSEGINAIRIIGNKVNLREAVIRGMQEEISLVSDKIEINTVAIEMMETEG